MNINGFSIPSKFRVENTSGFQGLTLPIGEEIQPFSSIYTLGVSTPISTGILEVDGIRVESNGQATITNIGTGEFYQVPIVDGLFTIYSYFDNAGNPVPIEIVASTTSLVGRLNTTLVNPRIVRIEGREALQMATKRTFTVFREPEQEYTLNFDYADCCYKEHVFASDDDDFWKNDKSSFLEKKALISESIVYELYKEGVLIATLQDNTLGEYYSFAFYTGFVLDWQKVYLAHGLGSYYVKTTRTRLGATVERFSQTYCLSLYSDYAANGTFRIETYQTGSVLRSGFNYDELQLEDGWYQSYRLKGRFGDRTVTTEKDYLMTSNREMLQIQAKNSYEYTLQTELLPSDIGRILIEDNLLANIIQISDYNLYNSEIYRRKEVILESVNDVKHYSHNRNNIYEVTFKDRFDNILKRT